MDAVIGMLLTVVPFGLFFLLFGGIMFWSGYLQPKQWSERWALSAAELGFELEPWQSRHGNGLFYRHPPSFKQRMMGRRGGFDVTCGVRVVVSGSGKNRSTTYYTFVYIALPQALGLGLRVNRKSSLGRLWSKVAGPSDIQIGIDAIDPLYEIHGTDPDRVAMLLRTPYVAEGLIAIAPSRFSLNVEDHMVRLEARSRDLDTAVLAPTIDSGVALAQRLLAARAEMGESTYETQIASVMQGVARDLSLAYDPAQLGVQGRLEGMYVEAHGAIEASRRVTHFVARFDRAMGLSLSLTKQTTMGAISNLLGSQDIDTGDPAFDARFIIKGAPEAAVRAALNPEVRRRLSELQDTAEELRVEDDRIIARVGYPMLEPEALERGLHAMAKVGGALARVAPKKIGPFRS